jgi:hypothetical protein
MNRVDIEHVSLRSRRGMVPALLFAFVLALVVYSTRAAPTVLFGDSGEMQTLGLVGGVAHQPGYPAFILGGYIFRHLGWPDLAYRITFMASFFGAATVAMLLVVLVEMGLSVMVACATALTFGGIYTVFLVALRAEVYTQAMFLSLVALWGVLRALRSGRDRDLLLAGFLLGISLTGHLSFGPAVVVMGLVLAWRVYSARRQRALPMLAALLGVFLLGLTPYLYLVWADAKHLPMNYIQSLEQCGDLVGRNVPLERASWQRVADLILGRGPYPRHLVVTDPRTLLRHFYAAARILSLYDLGLLGTLLALAGFVHGVRRDAARARLLALLAIVSFGFTIWVSPHSIIDLFLLPCLLYLSVFVGWGIGAVVQALGRWLGGGRVAHAALCLLAPVLLLIQAHGTRHWLDSVKIPRLSLEVDLEEYLVTPTFLPTLHDVRDARRFGEQALEVIPRGALVMGLWDALETMRYFQLAERRRPDLVLWPGVYPYLLAKIGSWQQEHVLREQPIVFLQWYPELAPHFTAVDSVRLAMGRTLYLAREPLKNLDRP